MNGRTSKVETLTMISIDLSSVLEIGDSHVLDNAAYVLSVQREPAIYFQNEFLFTDYPLFSAPQPLPTSCEPFEISTLEACNVIRVNHVKTSYLAASSVLQIGSNDCITLDSRTKNIRHLLREKPRSTGV